MKYLLGLMLIGIFAFSASAQDFAKADLIVKTVGSGTSYAMVLKKLGKPLRESKLGELDECTQGRGRTLYYEGFEIDLMGDASGKKQTVLDMKITSSKWATDKGVKIGDNYKTVMAKYGKTAYEDDFEYKNGNAKELTGFKSLTYGAITNDPGGVIFYFKNDRLVKIELKATTC